MIDLPDEFLSAPGSFEWDDNKRRSNIAKHGIDFFDAVEVFSDPHAYVFPARRQSGETRQILIGRAATAILGIVFTRRGSTARLISVRVARRKERQLYGSRQQKSE